MSIIRQKVGFIGAGNMSQAIMKAMLESHTILPEQVYASNRTPAKLKKFADAFKIKSVTSNEEVIDECEIIFLGVKPQDMTTVLEPLASMFDEHHIVISMAAGIPIERLQSLLPNVKNIVRIMPNTPAKVNHAVVGYCINQESFILENVIQKLLNSLGYLVKVEEGDAFEALTVSSGSGIAFIFELMQYWQSWIEDRGIDPATAKQMTIQTFLGASLLANKYQDLSLEELQSQVVSKKGVSQAGLESMRALSLENVLSASFEKAANRDRELSRS